MSTPAEFALSAIDLTVAAVGESARVECVLFDVLRRRCEEIGVREGSVLRVTGKTSTHLLVALETGETARVRREWAPFIHIRRAAPGGASCARTAAEVDADPPA